MPQAAAVTWSAKVYYADLIAADNIVSDLRESPQS